MNIIVAASENNAIGNKGGMPWHLSADLKYLKATTMGHTIIMGRKTYESIGRPLPGRRNVVVSRQPDLKIEGCEVYASLEEAIANAKDDEAFIMGGAQIYNQAWTLADRIYLTRVHAVIEEFDASVPPVPADMECVKAEDVAADEKNDYDVTFEVWERQK